MAKPSTLKLNSQAAVVKPITSATNNLVPATTVAGLSNALRLVLHTAGASSRLQSVLTNVQADTCRLRLGVRRAVDTARRSTNRILTPTILTRRRRSITRSAIPIQMMIVLTHRLNRSTELQVGLVGVMGSRDKKASVEVMAKRDKRDSKSLLVKSMAAVVDLEAVDMEKRDVSALKNLRARNMVDVKNMAEATKLAGAKERREKTNIKRSAVRSTARRDAKRAVVDGSLRFACISSEVVGNVSEA
jgi:hypothetical protein